MFDINRRDILRNAYRLVSLALANGLAARRSFAQDPRTLTIAWDTDIDTLDPAAFKSVGGYVVLANVYDSPLSWKVRRIPGSQGLYRSQPG